uniref:SCP2 domain-containing protein n=1 Tax=Bactrocera dorsalis TaxID=27457 RepID=A0A034WDL9_BACDO
MKSECIIEKIRNKLKDSNPDRRTVLSVFQFNFTDADGKLIKSVVFDFKDLNIYDGTTEAADAEITISDDDFYLVGTKETTFDKLVSDKKAVVKGDMTAIDKMLGKFRSASDEVK